LAKPPLPRFPGDGVLRGGLVAIYDLDIITGVPEPRFHHGCTKRLCVVTPARSDSWRLIRFLSSGDSGHT